MCLGMRLLIVTSAKPFLQLVLIRKYRLLGSSFKKKKEGKYFIQPAFRTKAFPIFQIFNYTMGEMNFPLSFNEIHYLIKLAMKSLYCYSSTQTFIVAPLFFDRPVNS